MSAGERGQLCPQSPYCQRSKRLSLPCLSNCDDDERVRTGTAGPGSDASSTSPAANPLPRREPRARPGAGTPAPRGKNPASRNSGVPPPPPTGAPPADAPPSGGVLSPRGSRPADGSSGITPAYVHGCFYIAVYSNKLSNTNTFASATARVRQGSRPWRKTGTGRAREQAAQAHTGTGPHTGTSRR